ncbi:MAG: GldG family protein, partial [Algicola sp.]|nr:GldG family protein [Algicola sp.]
MKNVNNSIGLLAIALLFVGSVLLNNVLFDRARVDLTENSIYSISDGTKELLTQLDEPINLYFFFSNKNSEGITSVRTYAARVQSLLEEYELYSDGKIKLHIIDPEPFSEAEDRAAEFGLTGANINTAGDSLYFGLGGSNALDEREIIAFFDPNKESFLEYDISKMVYQLNNPEPIKVGLISGLNMKGGQNPMTGQATQQWAVLQQLEQLYQVETIEPTANAILPGTNVLMLVHPKGLSDEMLYAIDQYVLKGGKLVVYVDPHAESGVTAMQGQQGPNSSDLNKLFAAWGVQMDNKVSLDAAKGLEIRMPSGGVGRHLGFIGLTNDNINGEDVVFADLESINGASFGALSQVEGATTVFSPMMRTSTHSQQVESFLYVMQSRNPEAMLKSFKSSDAMLTVA